MMEALRILKATGLPMKRTVRIGLWSGEEQGLLGSRAYVRSTFGSPDRYHRAAQAGVRQVLGLLQRR
jgi:Zn-dependent M28 family amino/carboxypeptidase